jgi:hypothetical protein
MVAVEVARVPVCPCPGLELLQLQRAATGLIGFRRGELEALGGGRQW